MPAIPAARQSAIPPTGKATSTDLLYLSYEGSGVSYYTYPGGAIVGYLQDGGKYGLCSDTAGNVYIVDGYFQQIDEYAHGQNVLLNRFYDFGDGAFGCSVDPATGNLAVAGGGAKSVANVAVYSNGQVLPTVYTEPKMFAFYYCTYDAQGNLFTEGQNKQRDAVLAELPKGSSSFSMITLDRPLYRGAGAVQWDGTYLAVGVPKTLHGAREVYQVQISGSAGTVVNTVLLNGGGDSSHSAGPQNQFWIQSSTIAMPKSSAQEIGLWAYPAGGKAQKFIPISSRPWGVTVSLGT